MASCRRSTEARKYKQSIEEVYGLTVYRDVVASPAGRRVAKKSRSSCRILMCAPGTNVYLVFESLFERDCAVVFWAMQGVRSVEAQFGPIKYTDRCGIEREHWADLKVVYDNGEVVLYCVRPVNKDKRGLLKAAVEDIRNHALKYYAHRIEILTEKVVTKAEIYRAREILSARRLKNSPDCVRMLELLKTKTKPVRAFELVQEFGNEGNGWIALWNLMGDGLAEHVTDDKALTFEPVSFVRARKVN
ncbi:hypothetical protein QA646_05420 [Rhizobium sp. CB3090]|uniref:hypothetical protein n=1 Tax=Rhizobium sp. CB3090 TaxID=3039156 RepID=UPI0024B120A5|nr:hypothetical protein [Rhizobium sp. CB3090]WFU10298.1 hypothetical protein QA646_05420 [Rhizobium sp. CB3090]